MRACAKSGAKGAPSWDCGGRGAWPRGGRGRLRDRGDNTQGELLDLSGAMLWFQGAIPAAIASAKRSGAVFVVFVAGERSGGPRYGGDTPPAYLQPPGSPAVPSCTERPGLPVSSFSVLPPSVESTAGLTPTSRFSRHPGRGTVSASPPKCAELCRHLSALDERTRRAGPRCPALVLLAEPLTRAAKRRTPPGPPHGSPHSTHFGIL